MSSRPRDLADRISSKSPEIFVLSLDEARTKARDIITRDSNTRFVPVIENWRQLSDGRIEFTVRSLRNESKEQGRR
jgi:hypothetical protein